MLNLNRVFISGNLGKDPETKPAGKTTVTKFSVGVNESWKDDAGVHEHTNWIPVVAWSRTGEVAEKYLRKGSRVLVEGSLRTSDWNDRENGQKRYKTELIASRIHFLDRKCKEAPAETEEEVPF